MAAGRFFRSVRILVLLLILFVVAMNAWLAKLRSTDWNEPLWLVVYPVNGDGSAATQRYVDGLERDDFHAIETFLGGEAARYGLSIRQPLSVRLAPSPPEPPPQPPAGGGALSVMLWSLKLRYWAFVNDTFEGPEPDVQMFVVYHDPAHHDRLEHSLGLQKGLIGVVNAFAARDLAQRNNVVIAHEFLHTLGASDKYHAASNLPLYPIGYADPARSPRYPQRKAEIMGGRIPLSEHRAVMPDSLSQCVIGPATALEIRWTS
ncbi:MAG: hypothetical protein PVI91_08700 [Gammaproteobacteria bacterium]|jgi:hypothetical protein